MSGEEEQQPIVPHRRDIRRRFCSLTRLPAVNGWRLERAGARKAKLLPVWIFRCCLHLSAMRARETCLSIC